jgi:hypothetical protein
VRQDGRCNCSYGVLLSAISGRTTLSVTILVTDQRSRNAGFCALRISCSNWSDILLLRDLALQACRCRKPLPAQTEETVKLRISFVVVALVSVCLLPIFSAHRSLQAVPPERVLKITLNYTGTGTVDEKHRIYVLLFDANPMTSSTLSDATSQATPPAPVAGVSHIIARESAASKNGAITFRGVAVSPVYAAFFFDKTGTYNGHADPSSGSPMGLYGTPPDKLEAIALEPGQPVQLTFSFDDSRLSP